MEKRIAIFTIFLITDFGAKIQVQDILQKYDILAYFGMLSTLGKHNLEQMQEILEAGNFFQFVTCKMIPFMFIVYYALNNII